MSGDFMFNNLGEARETPSALSERFAADARRYVERNALDAEDRAMLLSMLGLEEAS